MVLQIVSAAILLGYKLNINQTKKVHFWKSTYKIVEKAQQSISYNCQDVSFDLFICFRLTYISIIFKRKATVHNFRVINMPMIRTTIDVLPLLSRSYKVDVGLFS